VLSPLPVPHHKELGVAYEHYLEIDSEAHLTLDTTRLSKVTTGEHLEREISLINSRKEAAQDRSSSKEVKVNWLWILEYDLHEATIRVKETYRTFSQDLLTGVRSYDRCHYRIRDVLLEKEARIWKVKDLIFVDWSG